MLRLVNPPSVDCALNVPVERKSVPIVLIKSVVPVMLFVDTEFVLVFRVVRFVPQTAPVETFVALCSPLRDSVVKVKRFVDTASAAVTNAVNEPPTIDPVETEFVEILLAVKSATVNSVAATVIALKVSNAPETVINVVVESVFVLRTSIVAVLVIIF